ncbi:MAG: threonine/serine exporter, partial [Clostridium sp.]|nr:threonine/serine exporter [Clostridium sp.]
GIVPLVPGAGMYYTMLALVQKDFHLAASKGTETFFIAAAISIGVIISTFLSQSIKRVKFKA